MRWTLAASASVVAALAAALAAGIAHADDGLRVGSKRFTESYILGEIVTQTAASAGIPAQHRQGMGNTAVLFEALKTGGIDVYPEYLGTIDRDILHHAAPTSLEAINRELAPLGLGAAVRLGFENTYALAVAPGTAARDHLATIGDLARHPALRLGLSHEFLGRADGWPGLARRYALPQRPIGLDHGIAYDALANGQVDVIDTYSTDAKIARLHLRLLDDDLHYFPRYDAVLLYRLDLPRRFPRGWQALQALAGRIDAGTMTAMNAAAEIDGRPFDAIARDFLANGPATGSPRRIAAAGRGGLFAKLFDGNLLRLTRQHLMLVLVSVALATAIGIPLGVLAAFVRPLRQAVLAIAGVLQTIPSLALLAMLIPLLGTIGAPPALLALFLYALLPIVRNTCTGILQVPAGLREAATALGMTRIQALRHVELPLAMPVILAGMQTAAVASVGTATIAAFIGAGGYGERIATGLALNDHNLLLAGALPAAVLALATQAAFAWLEHRRRRLPR